MVSRSNFVDLDGFIEEYLKYEQVGANLIEANKQDKDLIDNLQRELNLTRKALSYQENKMGQLDGTMKSLKKSLCHALKFESENEVLVGERDQISSKLNNLREEKEMFKATMESHLAEMREKHLLELKSLQNEHQHEIGRAEQNLRQIETTKAEIIDRLRVQHRQVISSKDNEILKLKLQHEKKLSKSRSTPKQDPASAHSLQQIDIFRKKLQFVQSEAAAEISQLKQKISELQHTVQQNSRDSKRKKTDSVH